MIDKNAILLNKINREIKTVFKGKKIWKLDDLYNTNLLYIYIRPVIINFIVSFDYKKLIKKNSRFFKELHKIIIEAQAQGFDYAGAILQFRHLYIIFQDCGIRLPVEFRFEHGDFGLLTVSRFRTFLEAIREIEYR